MQHTIHQDIRPGGINAERPAAGLPRVKIFTRSFDLRLYRCSRGLYEMLGIPTVRLTDKSADGYFRAMLRDKDCDIAINIDEDAFVVGPEALMDLVRTVERDGYANAGCRDAGEALPRSGDPAVTNPFFNILNLRLIRSRLDWRKLRLQDTDLEPYYPLFRWMAEEFETLYLPAAKHPDGISTILYDPEGRPVCMHSWFARFYSMPAWVSGRIQRGLADAQRGRIDALMQEAYRLRGMDVPSFGRRDRLTFALDGIVRWCIKIPQRISRWPGKLRRRISRNLKQNSRRKMSGGR